MSTLSPRELQIIALIAAGKETHEIAEQLGVGVKTVGTHRHRARHKLGARNNVELCLWWQKNFGGTR